MNRSEPLDPAYSARLACLFPGESFTGVWRSLSQPKRLGVWVNALSGNQGGIDDLLEHGGEVLNGMSDTYVLPNAERQWLVSCPATTRGRYYPMNPSSVFTARCVAPVEGSQVLDLAAAPGGKTLVMAALMGNSGRIAAVEPVSSRYHRMRANLARCGVTNVTFYAADGRGVGRKVPERFSRVLLDAPCSSDARVRLHDPSTYRHWSERKIRESSRKQRRLILSAFQALAPGGVLTYCTCAFAPEENEAIVDYLLARADDAAVLPLALPRVLVGRHRPNTQAGLTRSPGTKRIKTFDGSLTGALRIVPDELWDGFFICQIGKAYRHASR